MRFAHIQKALISIIAATAITGSMAGLYLAQTLHDDFFSDELPEWAEESILELNKQQIIRGYDDGRFGAGDPLTRGQVITLLYRLLITNQTITAPGTCDIVFSDLWKEHYAFVAACSLLQHGWLDAARLLGPDEIMTRGETADLIRRVFRSELKGSDDPTDAERAFSDIRAAHPRGRGVAFMQNTGIMTGNPDGTFGADEPLNRAQAAVILHRALRALRGETQPPTRKKSNATSEQPSGREQRDWNRLHIQLLIPKSIPAIQRNRVEVRDGDIQRFASAIDVPVMAAVDLIPTDAHFDVPIGIALTMPYEPGTVPLLALVTANGIAVLDYIVIDTNATVGTASLLAEIRHFGSLVVVSVAGRRTTSFMPAVFAELLAGVIVEEPPMDFLPLNNTIEALQENLSSADKTGDLPLSLFSDLDFTKDVDLSGLGGMAPFAPMPHLSTYSELEKYMYDDPSALKYYVQYSLQSTFMQVPVKLSSETWDTLTGNKSTSLDIIPQSQPTTSEDSEGAVSQPSNSGIPSPSNFKGECRMIVQECSDIEMECDRLLEDTQKAKKSCAKSDRDCAEKTFELMDEWESCEKRHGKCVERNKFKDCLQGTSASSVQDTPVRSSTASSRVSIQSSAVSSSESSSVRSSSLSSVQSSASTVASSVATSAVASSAGFTCCESCPSNTDGSRYYFPIEGTNCMPGDVKRPDLNEASCVNPLYEAGYEPPVTYGPACSQ